jgi:hypothetical protein
MAKLTRDFVARFQTDLDADVEETEFAEGDKVRIVATWRRHYLIKDKEGHYYNVPHEVIRK